MAPFILGALGLTVVSTTTAATAITGTAAIGAATGYAVSKLLSAESKNVKTKEERIAVFQNNIKNLRDIAGIKTETIVNHLDITRQAIWNLEHGKSRMNATQYAGWGAILFAEGQHVPLFIRCFNIVFTDINSYSDKELEEAEKIIGQLARAVKADVDEDILETIASKLPPER